MSPAVTNVRRLDANASGFGEALHDLTTVAVVVDQSVERQVADILSDVRDRGDAAVMDYTRRFDRRDLSDFGELSISGAELQRASSNIDPSVLSALTKAQERIRAFHLHQVQTSWDYRDETGNRLGQHITPLERVGIYAPGGKAAYPSSVLMGAVPAKVAGGRGSYPRGAGPGRGG